MGRGDRDEQRRTPAGSRAAAGTAALLVGGALWAGAAEAGSIAEGWLTSGPLAANGVVLGVGVDRLGTAQVVYQDRDSGAVLRVLRRRDGGWTGPRRFDLPPGTSGLEENARGDIVAFGQSSGDLEVAVRRHGAWSPVATVATKVKSSSVLLNDAGQVLAVWYGSTGIHARIREADGRWGTAMRLAAPSTRGRQPVPVAAFGERGDAVVAWIRNVRPAVVLEVAERRPTGGWSRPRSISGAPVAIHGGPRVALNAASDALVGWVTGPVSTTQGRVLRVATHRIGGASWSRPARVPGARDVSAADLGLDDRGRAVAVWGSAGPNGVVASAVRSSAGRWIPAGALRGACCMVVPIVVTPAGTAVVALPSGNPEGVRVWQRRPGSRWTAAPKGIGVGPNVVFDVAANAAGDVVVGWVRGGGHTTNTVLAAAHRGERAG
jgi:hypothetical protein